MLSSILTQNIWEVHKHSGMGCAVVSLAAADTREAIMCYAEKTFGRSAAGKLEMDISDVKVQLSLGFHELLWYCWWFRNPKANHLGFF